MNKINRIIPDHFCPFCQNVMSKSGPERFRGRPVNTMACRADLSRRSQTKTEALAKADPPCEDFSRGGKKPLVRHYPYFTARMEDE